MTIRGAERATRLALVLFVGIATAVSIATVAEARSRTRPPCKTTGRTIAADEQARVYRTSETDTGYKVFACLLKPKRTVYLGAFDFEALGIRRVSLNGPSVGYEKVDCQHADCTGAIKVRNLRTGVLRRSIMPPHSLVADRVVASRSGAVAWTRRTRPGVVEVRALGASGERLLDSGPDVAPDSLALAGSTVYWKRGGQAYSASLP
jgi:hypothetical protein